ncbi:cytochrome P450-dit2 [Massospora cicadina]|nr:cytochrome P450-dit2 [Massospora cicadina]
MFGLLLAVLVVLALTAVTVRRWQPDKRIRPIPALNLLQTLKLMLLDLSYNEVHAMTRKITEAKKLMRMVSFGNWSVVVTSKEAVAAIVNDTATFPKASLTEAIPNTLFAKYMGSSVAFSHGDNWKRQRNVISPPFRRMFSIKLFYDLATQFIDQMKVGAAFDPYVYTQHITFDALGKALLGLDFGALSGNSSKFLKAYRGVTDAYLKYAYLAVPRLDSPTNPFRANAYRDLHYVEAFLASTIQHRRANLDVAATDILSLMIHSESNLTDEELMYNFKMFLVAGHDTTSFALSTAFYLLATHQDIQRELHAQIMGACGAHQPTLDQFKRIPLLDAVIRETMRMYPPSAILALRVATKDTTLCGYDIPKGTAIIPDVYAMHNDPEYWPEPEKFNPYRFLDRTGQLLERCPGPWLPFSGGERTCLGNSFSMLEQRVVLAKTIASYNLTLVQLKPFTLINTLILRME